LTGEVAAAVYKTEINGRRDPSRSPRDTHLPAEFDSGFANGGHSVGIVLLRIHISSFHDFVNTKRKAGRWIKAQTKDLRD
jgi:hypothetical protein